MALFQLVSHNLTYNKLVYTYLLLTECAVRTVSYGPSFLTCLMAQARSARAIKRGGKRGSITFAVGTVSCGPEN